ncbi:MAG: methionyl-tRNA formyltransferase [Sedimentisphaeraceae bacterium JB056]
MKIVYCGSSPFGIPSLEAIKSSEHQLAHVITQPAHRAGRGRALRPTAVAQWAADNDLPCSEAECINAPEIIELMNEIKPDLSVVIAFGQKIGQEFIKSAKYEAINVHASLLPDYRGAAPINWAIIDGKTHSGVTIITLAEKMDAGFMLGKAEVEIRDDENAKTLHDKLAIISPPLLLDTIEKIGNGTAVFETQDESKVTFARKLKKKDGFIDWNNTAKNIANKVRGLWPWPGVKTEYVIGQTGKCVQITIAEAVAVERSENAPEAVGRFDENMNVVCGEGALKILRLKPANSHLMDFADFENGRCSGPHDLFMSVEPDNV